MNIFRNQPLRHHLFPQPILRKVQLTFQRKVRRATRHLYIHIDNSNVFNLKYPSKRPSTFPSKIPSETPTMQPSKAPTKSPSSVSYQKYSNIVGMSFSNIECLIQFVHFIIILFHMRIHRTRLANLLHFLLHKRPQTYI